ncbi:MAG: hypothetical protein KA984_01690, partial [Candidatus Cloacimonetes bacterium]|nr:hypothetical protein [Candidatus Cloacimonadota bacterium]
LKVSRKKRNTDDRMHRIEGIFSLALCWFLGGLEFATTVDPPIAPTLVSFSLATALFYGGLETATT